MAVRNSSEPRVRIVPLKFLGCAAVCESSRPAARSAGDVPGTGVGLCVSDQTISCVPGSSSEAGDLGLCVKSCVKPNGQNASNPTPTMLTRKLVLLMTNHRQGRSGWSVQKLSLIAHTRMALIKERIL